MIEIKFDGETVIDVVNQMNTFIAAFNTHSKPATRAPKTGKPVETETKVEAKTETKANDKPVDKSDELLAKQQAEAKDEALATARELFATGTEGQAKVRAVAKEFGKKKLSEVPVEDAFRLRELINDAQQELKAAEKASDGDAI